MATAEEAQKAIEMFDGQGLRRTPGAYKMLPSPRRNAPRANPAGNKRQTKLHPVIRPGGLFRPSFYTTGVNKKTPVVTESFLSCRTIFALTDAFSNLRATASLAALATRNFTHGFGWDLDLGACPRVAPHASGAMLLTNLPKHKERVDFHRRSSLRCRPTL